MSQKIVEKIRVSSSKKKNLEKKTRLIFENFFKKSTIKFFRKFSNGRFRKKNSLLYSKLFNPL